MDNKNVDYEIEQFLGFKNSMNNFYKNQNLNRPIKLWSDNLNFFQSKKQYEQIEICITKYISLYALDLMRIDNGYNISILNTNIKRWDKISNKYKIFSNRKNYNKGCNLITTLFDIHILLSNKGKIDRKIFDEVELYIIFGDFRDLLKFSKEHEIPSIIDKLLNYDSNIFSQVKEIFGLDDSVVYPISSSKIFKIKNLNLNKK